MRALVLRRDGYRCQVKHLACTTLATHAHHLDGKAAGDDPNRIVASCMSCNLTEGDPVKGRDPEPVVRPWWEHTP